MSNIKYFAAIVGIWSAAILVMLAAAIGVWHLVAPTAWRWL